MHVVGRGYSILCLSFSGRLLLVLTPQPESTLCSSALATTQEPAARESSAKLSPSSQEDTTVEKSVSDSSAELGEAEGASEAGAVVPKDEVLVSNEALRDVDTKQICTLEVLVRHTRDRVGENGVSRGAGSVNELVRYT